MIYRLQVVILFRKWHSFCLEESFSTSGTNRIKFRKAYLLELIGVLLHKSSIYLNFSGSESGCSDEVKSRVAMNSLLLTHQKINFLKSTYPTSFLASQRKGFSKL